ncbi:MAG: EscU/YscU/HrcU family type III secretion system export apparatus switch protein [Deltaproteobacteria bacterium]|nr:EscU/YscU/HrcU family type III secretion system export apparatus switch protein [Deltaproteobacteria bacterium]
MASDDAANKSEKATPQRRKKAREEGQLARARDAGGVAATAGVLLVLAVTGPSFARTLQEFASWCFGRTGDLAHADPRAAVGRMLAVVATLAVPSAVAAAVGSTAIGFAQAGFQPQLDLLAPKWNRMDPLARLKSMMVSPQTLIELALSVARVGVVGYVAYTTVADALPTLSALSRAGLVTATVELWHVVGQLVLRSTIALVVLAAADYLQSWLRLEKQLRMSRQEVKEEMKQQEGDPQIRARQRARARESLKKGLSKQVRASDVIVTNPTHVAVAIRYRRGLAAPVVAAKGYDEMALHIRQIAKEAGVPIVENRLLARELARRVRVGRPVPVDLYAAVAEVLAFVYRLRGQFWA